MPVVSKDLIKESLFDTLGAGDREWSKKVGLASIALLFRLIEVQLEVGQSIIAECNFYREFDIPKFRLLKEKYTLRTVEVHCAAERQVLVSRMKHRLSSGERHAGHAESPGVHAEVYAALDRGSFEPLNIGDTLVRYPQKVCKQSGGVPSL